MKSVFKVCLSLCIVAITCVNNLAVVAYAESEGNSRPLSEEQTAIRQQVKEATINRDNAYDTQVRIESELKDAESKLDRLEKDNRKNNRELKKAEGERDEYLPIFTEAEKVYTEKSELLNGLNSDLLKYADEEGNVNEENKALKEQEISSLEATLPALQSDNDLKQNEMETAKAEYESKAGTLQGIENDIAQLQADRLAKETALKEANESKTRMNAEKELIATMLPEVDTLIAESEEADKLTADTETKKGAYETLKAQYEAAAEEEKPALEEQVSASEKEFKEAEEKSVAKIKGVGKLKTEILNQMKSVEGLLNDKMTPAEIKDVMSKYPDQFDNDLKAAEETIKILDSDILAIDEAMPAKEAERETAEVEANNAKAVYDEKLLAYEEANTALSALLLSIENAKLELAKFTPEYIESLKESIAQVTQELTAAKAEYDVALKKNTELTERAEKLAKEKEELGKEISSLKKKISELSDSFDSAARHTAEMQNLLNEKIAEQERIDALYKDVVNVTEIEPEKPIIKVEQKEDTTITDALKTDAGNAINTLFNNEEDVAEEADDLFDAVAEEEASETEVEDTKEEVSEVEENDADDAEILDEEETVEVFQTSQPETKQSDAGFYMMFGALGLVIVAGGIALLTKKKRI